eukprot:augustus_masked-scaffold_8-processed-gene-2.10-mRNA-1 protein AED:0.94 eAED:1.00 QI:324/0/0/0.5/1/1/2/0/617
MLEQQDSRTLVNKKLESEKNSADEPLGNYRTKEEKKNSVAVEMSTARTKLLVNLIFENRMQNLGTVIGKIERLPEKHSKRKIKIEIRQLAEKKGKSWKIREEVMKHLSPENLKLHNELNKKLIKRTVNFEEIRIELQKEVDTILSYVKLVTDLQVTLRKLDTFIKELRQQEPKIELTTDNLGIYAHYRTGTIDNWGIDLNLEERKVLGDKLLLLGVQKTYGIDRTKLSSTECKYFKWLNLHCASTKIWEFDLNLVDAKWKDWTKCLKAKGSQLKKLQAKINTSFKLICSKMEFQETILLNKNAEKYKKKIDLYEEKVLKILREEEKQKIRKEKANAEREEKTRKKLAELAKAKPPKVITLGHYFSPSTARTESKLKTKRPIKSKETLDLLKAETGKNEMEILSKYIHSCKLRRKRQLGETLDQGDVQFLGDEANNLLEVLRARKKKFFSFSEDNRPAYYGTGSFALFRNFLKSEKTLRRDPFVRVDDIDYDYDSGLDWEEPEDGESLASSQSVASNDDLDYNDGWLEKDTPMDSSSEQAAAKVNLCPSFGEVFFSSGNKDVVKIIEKIKLIVPPQPELKPKPEEPSAAALIALGVEQEPQNIIGLEKAVSPVNKFFG